MTFLAVFSYTLLYQTGIKFVLRICCKKHFKHLNTDFISCSILVSTTSKGHNNAEANHLAPSAGSRHCNDRVRPVEAKPIPVLSKAIRLCGVCWDWIRNIPVLALSAGLQAAAAPPRPISTCRVCRAVISKRRQGGLRARPELLVFLSRRGGRVPDRRISGRSSARRSSGFRITSPAS